MDAFDGGKILKITVTTVFQRQCLQFFYHYGN